jgi:D-alanyl-D-alanine carboxypeptidase
MHPLQRECQRLVEAGSPGAFVYHVDAGREAQFYTAGFADLATRQPMTPDLHYRVGSTTKTFTAVVLLQLLVEGKLTLTDTLDKWLPNLPIPNAAVLTIEHLLRMRSGLFDFEEDASLVGNLDAHRQPCTLEQAIHLSIKHPASFLPGTKYEYCNTNFCLLELIIERITGHGLAVELERRIFGPIGMTDSSYPDEEDLTLPEPYIRGYERTADGWEECSQVFFGRGDGALISTARDLAKFFRAVLFERTLLPDELLQQMMTVIQDQPPAEEMYGLGLMADPLSSGTVWGHPGGGYGYRNSPYIKCETGRFIVFMLNSSYGFHIATGVPPVPDRSVRTEAYKQEDS